MPDVERDAALARIFVVELPAHVGIGHAAQRRRGALARLAAADGRHRGKPRVRMALELDFKTLRTEGAEEPRAAGRGEKPGEVEDADAVERKRLAAPRLFSRPRRVRVRIDRRRAALRKRVDVAGILI